MALATLTDLQTAIADFGQARTDLTTSAINDFITLAENDVVNGTFDAGGNLITPPLRVRSMETKNTSFTLSGEYTDLPSGYLQMREVSWSSQTGKPPRKWTSPEACGSDYSASNSGPATVWTVVGSQIRVGPGASVSDMLTIVYYADPPALLANNTNWLLTNYPNVYLYGALRHLAPYTGAVDMLAIWQPAFVSAVMGVIRSEATGSFSGTSMAQRSVGMTIT